MKRYLLASGFSLLLLACQGLSAGQLYRFQDADGNVLLTNQVDKQRKPLRQDRKQYHRLVKVTWYPDTNVHSYRNWGKTEVAVKASASKNRNAFDDTIRLAAQQYELDFGLIKAVIHTESGFDPKARSGPGAQGLMQLMPTTAQWVSDKLGVPYRAEAVNDPEQNMRMGTYYLSHVLEELGHPVLATAGYNAGPRRAREWQADSELDATRYIESIPFAETRDYAKKVMTNAVHYALALGWGETRLTARLGSIPARPTSIIEGP